MDKVLLVENTRYEDVDGKKESKNDPELGKYWASLGDGIFVMMHSVQLTVHIASNRWYFSKR